MRYRVYCISNSTGCNRWMQSFWYTNTNSLLSRTHKHTHTRNQQFEVSEMKWMVLFQYSILLASRKRIESQREHVRELQEQSLFTVVKRIKIRFVWHPSNTSVTVWLNFCVLWTWSDTKWVRWYDVCSLLTQNTACVVHYSRDGIGAKNRTAHGKHTHTHTSTGARYVSAKRHHEQTNECEH